VTQNGGRKLLRDKIKFIMGVRGTAVLQGEKSERCEDFQKLKGTGESSKDGESYVQRSAGQRPGADPREI